ncbi:uncharacterized protein LOC135692259 isoform X2 [Rhopilema esculentum]|uniref:uncharacterized protein LOC135692259 isoform X2 n=1 Tax=Rhopilema esculentum TaxID=499914 RepID=UPI0031D7870B
MGDLSDAEDQECHPTYEFPPESTSDAKSLKEEPKYVVFHTMLMQLFCMFCFHCHDDNPEVSMQVNGTMVTVLQECAHCGKQFQWRSQPLVLGRFPAGNVLFSFSVLMAGASISKMLLAMKHFGLSVISARTFCYHQQKFLFPVILRHWEEQQQKLLSTLSLIKDSVWAGDGRFDSIGHSTKFGTYTMLSPTLMKIVHFELVQANEAGSSNAMELFGAKKCFTFLLSKGIRIPIFISDRHRGIAKWIRENQPLTSHFFDLWHVARTICKKVLMASKEKGCEVLSSWVKNIKKHLYWCASSTKLGFGALVVAKWESFLQHVTGSHKDHPNSLFKNCLHGEIKPRKWLKIGSPAYDKLLSICQNKRILEDISKLSPDAQTSSLEAFHALLNHWHPKMICFSWMGTMCRHILASLHFNENVKRDSRKSKDGKTYYHVKYPKFKLGEETVREITMKPTYMEEQEQLLKARKRAVEAGSLMASEKKRKKVQKVQEAHERPHTSILQGTC